MIADDEVNWSRCMLDRFLFNDIAHLGNVLAGSRRRIARTQERYSTEERDQGEG
jgi:hypothetical protein